MIFEDGGFGTWQARIPESDGETVTARYILRELLDELIAGPNGLSGGHSTEKGNSAPVPRQGLATG